MRIIFTVLIVFIYQSAALSAAAKDKTDATPLGKIHEKIIHDYPSITHISRAELEKQLLSDDMLLLDTRPINEYNISHISGSVQVDPHISPEAFQLKFGDSLRNKNIIVYCSVGRRSSKLGERLQNAALSIGAISLRNMEGGLFGWHNDGRPLVNSNGATTAIHPYNVFWGRLIDNKKTIRYRP